MVGIPDPERRLKAYPHEMSGGMAQRVMIAMALACEPELLIADEPTTALDVTIQAQILDLMRTLQRETGTAIILITHDLGVVAEMCDRVAVMYAGEIVEQTDVGHAVRRAAAPVHPGPHRRGPGAGRDPATSWPSIPGSVPNLIELPDGCRFAPRCAARVEHGNVLATERIRSCGRSTAATTCAAGCTTTRDGSARPRPWPTCAAGGTRSGARSRRPGPSERPAPRSSAARVSATSSTARAAGRPRRPARRGPRPRQVTSRSRAASCQRDRRRGPGRGRRRPRRSRAARRSGLVGESGCGKTTVGPAAPAADRRPPRADPLRRPRHHRASRARALQPYRRRMQIIFQDPYASLDPRMPDRRQHRRGAAHPRPRRRRPSAAAKVAPDDGPRRARSRTTRAAIPHEFCGGQRQRIGIARALVLEPDLIVCDEPVSALDVSIQAQVLNLLKSAPARARPDATCSSRTTWASSSTSATGSR